MKKQQWVLIGITCVFLCLILGVFIGRNFLGVYIPIGNAPDSNSTGTTQQEQISDGRIDLNTATLQQLQLMPGIGEITAQKILDYRAEFGSFTSVEELMNISGIGEKKFAQIEPYVKIGGNNENSGS